MLFGHDISKWQGAGNPADGDFVIAKASQGTNEVDVDFASHHNNALRSGKLFGSYHYADGTGSAIAEADYYLRACQHHTGEIMALDFEGAALNMPSAVPWALAFLNRVFQVAHVRPLIYLQYSALSSRDWLPVAQQNFGLWVAAWGTSQPANVAPWAFAAMWQSGNGGGVLDSDRFNGDRTAWMKYGGYGATPPIPSPPPTTHTYIVREGDNLSSIAAKLHTTWQYLAGVNHLHNPNLIFPGQVLHY